MAARCGELAGFSWGEGFRQHLGQGFPQHNLLAEKVKHIMREPGRPKFVLNVDRFDADKLNALLARFDLKLGASPCLPIETNLEGHALSLCPVADG